MIESGFDPQISDLAERDLSGPAWEAWQAAHPEQAAEVVVARQVRLLLQALGEAGIQAPAGFEERLLARVRADSTFLSLIDLGLSGIAQALMELLDLIFDLLSGGQMQQTAV